MKLYIKRFIMLLIVFVGGGIGLFLIFKYENILELLGAILIVLFGINLGARMSHNINNRTGGKE